MKSGAPLHDSMGFLKTHKLLHGIVKNPLMCYIKSHGCFSISH